MRAAARAYKQLQKQGAIDGEIPACAQPAALAIVDSLRFGSCSISLMPALHSIRNRLPRRWLDGTVTAMEAGMLAAGTGRRRCAQVKHTICILKLDAFGWISL